MEGAVRVPLVLSVPLAAVAGVVHTLVFPPVGAAALAWVALVPVLLLLRVEDRVWAGALLGWGFGLAAGGVAVGWIYDVLAWELDLRRLVSAVFTAGVVGFSTAAFAGFGALAVVLRRRVPFALAAPLAWTAAEWARSELVEGLPWLLYGHSQYESTWVLQLAELGGVPAISFVLVAVNALLAEASLPGRWWRMGTEASLPGSRAMQEEPAPGRGPAAQTREAPAHAMRPAQTQEGPAHAMRPAQTQEASAHATPAAQTREGPAHAMRPAQMREGTGHAGALGRVRLRRVGGAAVVVAVVAGFGAWRAASFSAPAVGDPVPVGLVQAATPQGERWRPETRRRNLEAQLELTRRARERGARLVVWSETALDFQPGEIPQTEVSELLDGALGSEPGWALVGAVEPREDGRQANAAVLFDAGGRRLDAYAKVQLVPFLERGRPDWVGWVPGLSQRLQKMTAQEPYAAGDGASPIEVAGLRLGMLICYEAIYPDGARAAVEAGANVLVNLTNDGFFPPAAVAEQHLAMSVPRAVETRRPLVRVANRGVGALVEPSGRIRMRVERDARAAPVVEVTPRRGRTLYTESGHLLGEACAFLAVLGCLWERVRS